MKINFFGMNEKELKEFAQQLDERERQLETERRELDERENSIRQNEEKMNHERELLDAAQEAFKKERQSHVKKVKASREQIASEQADLEKRREEIICLEADAQTGFVKSQEDKFRRIIEKRLAELNTRQASLDKLSKEIAGRLDDVTAKEGEIADRELKVTEREQLADAGFADKAASLAAETKRQHDANLEKARQLDDREKELSEEKLKLEVEKDALRKREQGIADAELQRDTDYSDLRADLDRELNENRLEWQKESTKKRSALRKELAETKTQKLAEMDEEIAGIREARLAEIDAAGEKLYADFVESAKKEAQRIHDGIDKERTAWDAERGKQQADLKTKNDANEAEAGRLAALDAKLNGKQVELENLKRHLDILESELDDRLQDRVEEFKMSKEQETADLKEEIQRLRKELHSESEMIEIFEEMKRRFHDEDPAIVLAKIDEKNEELKQLRKQLANPPSELRERIDALEKENEREKGRADKLQERLDENEAATADAKELRRKKVELESENASLKRVMKKLETEAEAANTELNRLRSIYERPAEIAARYEEIEMPYIKAGSFVVPKSSKVNELDWLNGIHNRCKEYGLDLPMRILKAFHTSLKTAEWSPLTVLAGVSGTGKSELPRAYSHFGGLMYMLLSVQPNWDSQESMLGFFNAIDNKFDAQPVLRFLAQSQQMADEPYEKRIARWTDMAQKELVLDPDKNAELIKSLQKANYPGLCDCVCLVLLDEMNLAHPELYFAEFLSQLEFRRGMKKGVVPYLPVKIGAGQPPYQLPLGRNVLWAGTMNQDETTKSLSDKVLDRSMTIFFPRPTTLVRRKKLKTLDDTNRGELIARKDYFDWIVQFSKKKEILFTDEQIKPYKKFLEDMSDALGGVGRAIGHRVWQSVEYYMANYPDVRAILYGGGDEFELRQAMHTAFEDQLVQKVMPKLRGIETRGIGKDCLDIIQGQLNAGTDGKNPFNLNEDFQRARELGHGQFIWQSANYLNEETSDKKPSDDDADADAEEQSETESPAKSKKAKSRKKG